MGAEFRALPLESILVANRRACPEIQSATPSLPAHAGRERVKR